MPKQDHHRRRIQLAMEYIEQHLTERISVEDIARAAHVSPFHFHRVFASFTGESIQKYVQSRRMEWAARTLRRVPGTGLLDLALAVGYETHSAFSRSFRRHFGVSPSSFVREDRHPGPDRTRPYLLTDPVPDAIQPVDEYTIGNLVFRHRITSTTIDGHFFAQPEPRRDLQSLWDHHSDVLMGVVSGYPASPQSLNDDSAEAWYGGLVPVGRCLPWSGRDHVFGAGRWVVFRHRGDFRFLHQTWSAIYRSWWPQSGLPLRDDLPFEMYLSDPRQTEPADCIADIWLPVNEN